MLRRAESELIKSSTKGFLLDSKPLIKNMSDTIVLVSNDGHRVTFDGRIHSFSNLVKDIKGDDASPEDIPTKVSVDHLTKIKEFFEHHSYEKPASIEYPLKSANLHDSISQWDLEFVAGFSRDEFQVFYDMVDYLQIQVLMDLCGATIASWFKGKTLDQIQQDFGLPPFSEAIEAELKVQHSWALDETD